MMAIRAKKCHSILKMGIDVATISAIRGALFMFKRALAELEKGLSIARPLCK